MSRHFDGKQHTLRLEYGSGTIRILPSALNLAGLSLGVANKLIRFRITIRGSTRI